MYEYAYTSSGQLYRFDDVQQNRSTVYKYDSNGRLQAIIESDRENEYAPETLFVTSLSYNKNSQIELICGDVKNLNDKFDTDSFDVVTCNPPYFKTDNKDFLNNNDVKSLARHEVTLNLDDVLKNASYLLKSGGIFAMVHRTERFIEIIEKMKQYNIEPKRIQFIYPKKSRESDLFLIEGIKNGNSGVKLLAPLIVHKDENTYTDEVIEILNF